MAFIALFFPLFLAILLIAQVSMMVESALAWAVQNAHLINLAVAVLLAVNLACLLILLKVRGRWKREGRLEQSYWNQFSGWRRFWRSAMKWLLPLGALWEGWVVFWCAVYLVVQPLQYLPR